MSILCEREGLQVLITEIEPGAALAEGSLWHCWSWHLVVAGQAIFEQSDDNWELLNGQSLYLSDLPYTVVNPSPERTRILSLLFKRQPLE
jgi:hypothetical protein